MMNEIQFSNCNAVSRPKKAKVAKKFQNPHRRHATGLAGPKSRGAVRGAMTMPATRRLALLALPLLLGVLTVTHAQQPASLAGAAALTIEENPDLDAQERARAAQREAAFAQAEI